MKANGKAQEEPLLPVTSPPSISSELHSSDLAHDNSNCHHWITERNYLRRRDIIKVDKEAFISVSKYDLLRKLAVHIKDEDRNFFIPFGNRVFSNIRAWYNPLFEETLRVYSDFDPQDNGASSPSFPPSTVPDDQKESLFLRLIIFLLKKSNYSLISDMEMEVALRGSFLLNLPIQVDTTKLNAGLWSRFLESFPLQNRPSFSPHYLMFRRGMGSVQSSGYFMNDKIDLVILRALEYLAAVFCCFKAKPDTSYLDIRKLRDEFSPGIAMERVRLENFKLSFENLLSKNTLQEPSFERIVIIYRLEGSHSIFIKQFRNIPMADMDIVLPEKVTPGLRAMDWASFVVTVFGGLIAVFASIQLQFSVAVALSILAALVSYILKVNFAWTERMESYQLLLHEALEMKLIDSNRGTLLHLYDDVAQQEFKEALVSYFVLQREGPLEKEVLRERCEDLLHEEFGSHVRFEVTDAVNKLQRLGLLKKEANGKLSVLSVRKATEVIGATTDEKCGISDWQKFIEPNGVWKSEF